MRSTFAVLLAVASAALAAPFNFTSVAKRDYENVPFTWYNTGLGACGGTNSDNEYVVALNAGMYNGGQYCYKQITISAWGKTTTAAIVDECPGCGYGGLDLAPALFDFFTWPGAHGSSTDPGVLYGSWDFIGGGGGSSGGNRIHPNWDTSKCLDVAGGNMANGTPVQIYDCNGTGAQNWIIHQGTTTVQVAGTNYCLDAGTSWGDGTKMKIWSCIGGTTQQTWFLTGDNRIALQNQGLCLDLTNGSKNDGNVMQTWSCTTNDNNQVWTLS